MIFLYNSIVIIYNDFIGKTKNMTSTFEHHLQIHYADPRTPDKNIIGLYHFTFTSLVSISLLSNTEAKRALISSISLRSKFERTSSD